VLDELVRSRPNLGAEAERLARQHLLDTDAERVAEAVAWELQHCASHEVFERAGDHGLGYVDPTEAAWELLEDAVSRVTREIVRLLSLGMTGPAANTALGMIAGLYRCRDCDDNDLALSWSPDFPQEHAECIVDSLAKSGLELPADLLDDVAPEWAHRLTNRKGAPT
jgi:hypothetical protein